MAEPITFGLNLGEHVVTNLGQPGIITFQGNGYAGVEYCVRTPLHSEWYKEAELTSAGKIETKG